MHGMRHRQITARFATHVIEATYIVAKSCFNAQFLNINNIDQNDVIFTKQTLARFEAQLLKEVTLWILDRMKEGHVCV